MTGNCEGTKLVLHLLISWFTLEFHVAPPRMSDSEKFAADFQTTHPLYTVSYRINCQLLNKHYAFQKMKTRHNKRIHHVYAAYVAYLFGHSFLHTFQLLFFSHIWFFKKKIYGIRGQCNFVCFMI